MNIPNICSNPDCTSRLHFIGGGYVYRDWLYAQIEAEILEEEEE